MSGKRERWTAWEKKSPLRQLAAFLESIFRTAQNWMDSSQMRTTGFRDRIAHVQLTEEEGGMNLTMSDCAIKRLAKRGECAAEILASRFSLDPPAADELTWENQRWIRYRNYMQLLEQEGQKLRRGYLDQRDGERTMTELNERVPLDSPPGYRWETSAQRSFAVETTGALLNLIKQWDDKDQCDKDQCFALGAPADRPDLRIMPRL